MFLQVDRTSTPRTDNPQIHQHVVASLGSEEDDCFVSVSGRLCRKATRVLTLTSLVDNVGRTQAAADFTRLRRTAG